MRHFCEESGPRGGAGVDVALAGGALRREKRAMRDLIEEIFINSPLDPMEAARRGARPQPRRKFYRAAEVAEVGGAFAILLDARPVKTPARRALAAPTRSLAQALAAEWDAQAELIDPISMPLSRLANSIIDGVVDAPEAVVADIEKYLASDLLVYRAGGPEGLVARQAQHWDPLIEWAREELGASFVLGEGINFVAQPAGALLAARAAIPRDPWRLGAVHAITTLTGSALIALALDAGQLSADAAWAAANVDEDWNMERWGPDELALERRRYRQAEMQAAAAVLALLPAQ
jgi:chaperone required for assembly of F1-ATPase